MFLGKKTARTALAVFCALAVAGCGFGAQGTKAYAASADDPYNINIGIGGSETEVRFCWQSASSKTGQLQIAKADDVKSGAFPAGSTKYAALERVTATEGYLDNAVSTNTDHPISSFKAEDGTTALTDEYSNKVTVSLSANTSYTYRVGDGTTWSKDYTFRTGSAADGFTFAAFGDPQIGASGDVPSDTAGWADTLRKVTAKYPSADFLFSMGDQVNDYDHVYQQQTEYKGFFNPIASADYLQTHILAAFTGNHDFQMGKYYSYHYNQPNLSPLGQTVTNNVPDRNGDFWFRYGNTLFMVLEGNNFYGVSAHDQFMSKAISANPGVKWKVTAFHQAPYSEANHDGASSADDDVMFMRQNWTKLMDKYDVDIVLNGHDHYYTRSYQMLAGSPVSTEKTQKVTDPKGTVYFTLDSGSGSKYYKYNESQDHSFSAFGWQNKVPTYTYAEVTDSAFTLTTYATNSDTPIDTYTISKTQAPASSSKGGSGGTVSNPASGTQPVSTTQPVPTVSNPPTGDDDGNTPVIFIIAAGALLIAACCVAVIVRRKKAGN